MECNYRVNGDWDMFFIEFASPFALNRHFDFRRCDCHRHRFAAIGERMRRILIIFVNNLCHDPNGLTPISQCISQLKLFPAANANNRIVTEKLVEGRSKGKIVRKSIQ